MAANVIIGNILQDVFVLNGAESGKRGPGGRDIKAHLRHRRFYAIDLSRNFIRASSFIFASTQSRSAEAVLARPLRFLWHANLLVEPLKCLLIQFSFTPCR